MVLRIDNNFVIPAIWKLLRQNDIKAEIVIPVQMNQESEKWVFGFDHYKLQGLLGTPLSEQIGVYVNPLDYILEYPFTVEFNHYKYSISKCLDWLVANMNDNEWLFDDFRGTGSTFDLFGPGRLFTGVWANQTVSIRFAKEEDANYFKIVRENFCENRT